MGKRLIEKVSRFMPFLFVLFAILFMLISFVTAGSTNLTLVQYLQGSIPFSLKFLLIFTLLTCTVFSILTFLKNDLMNMITLIVFVLTFTVIICWEQIHLLVLEETIKLSYGTIIALISLGFSIVFTLREVFKNINFTIREMLEMSILVALAVVFDFIPKIKVGATGGSISLTMLPLFILAFRFNFVKSFIACGVVYGLITCLTDGYGFATYPFDYLLGFGLISLSSLFRNLINAKKTSLLLQYLFFGIAVLIGGLSRFIGATLSSMIIYQTTLWGGLTYNATYIIPSVLACVVILILLFPFLRRLNVRYPLTR